MLLEGKESRRWDATATVASIVAWGVLVPLIGVAVTRPEGTSDEGCLDVCLSPALWFLLDLMMTPVVFVAALIGAVTGWVAKSRRPAGLGHTAWWFSIAALVAASRRGRC